MTTPFSARVLDLDCAAEVDRICTWMVDAVSAQLHRRGVIIAMSGGIDSSVCAALAVRALGTKKVYGLLLPERDSSGFSSARGRQLAEHLGIAYEEKEDYETAVGYLLRAVEDAYAAYEAAVA